MAKKWYLLKSTPPVFNSGYEQEDFDHYAVDGFNELLETPAIASSVILSNSDFSVNNTVKAIIQNVTSDNKNSSLNRQILVNIGTLKDVYYVTHQNRIWFVTGLIDNNKIYEKAILTLCTFQLRWQNKLGEIVSRWCISENATKYSSGIVNNKIIVLPELQYNIKLPLDNETKNLRRDKRFLDSVEDIEGYPTAYKLTQRDTISNNYGDSNQILNITLVETSFDPEVDNKELLIADYFVSSTPHNGQAEIIYTGQPRLFVGGNWKYFSAIFKDEDDNVINDIIPVWEFICLPNHVEYFTFESLDDDRFRVKADLNTALIGSSVKVVLSDADDLYFGELLVDIVDY